jgi:hypothetical protein
MSKQSEAASARRALDESNRLVAEGHRLQREAQELALRDRALSAAQSHFIAGATADDVITVAERFLSFLRLPQATARRPSASARAKASRKAADSSAASARRSAAKGRSRR